MMDLNFFQNNRLVSIKKRLRGLNLTHRLYRQHFSQQNFIIIDYYP